MGSGLRRRLLWSAPVVLAVGCSGHIGDGTPWPVDTETTDDENGVSSPEPMKGPIAGRAGSSSSPDAAGAGGATASGSAGAAPGGSPDDGVADNPPADSPRPNPPSAAGSGGGSGGGEAGSGGSAAPVAGTGDAGGSAPMPMAGSSGASGAGGGEVVPGGVRFLGRVDAGNPNAVRFSWSGAGVIATVKGTTLAVKLRTESATAFFQSVVDGKAGMRFEVASGADRTIMLASGLSDTDHRVELYRETEGGNATSAFLGFTSGTVKGAPAASDRYFEIIGDSITAGLGALGSESHANGSNSGGCNGGPNNSTWYQSYEAVAARGLGAEVSTLARSGFGMYRGGDGNQSTVMPPLFDDVIAGGNPPTWNFSRTPAAVIINLGTNDWAQGDPGTPYETAYINFVQQVRMRYPQAWILLTIGTTLWSEPKGQVDARLQRVVSARTNAGDTKIAMFDLGIQDTNTTGCGWHPSAAEHSRMGEVLRQQLSMRLGW